MTLNAAEYGVPQVRERVFLVGSREGIGILASQQRTHRDPSCDGSSLVRLLHRSIPHGMPSVISIRTMTMQALTANVVSGLSLLPSPFPRGQNYLFHTKRGGWQTPVWVANKVLELSFLKLAKNRPSWTVCRRNQVPPLAHSTGRAENSVRKELCRLQTFPDQTSSLTVRTEMSSACWATLFHLCWLRP